MLFLEQRQEAGVNEQFVEFRERVKAGGEACASRLPFLLFAQVCYDFPSHQALGAFLNTVRTVAADVAASPIFAGDMEYAKAIATFDEEVFTLALLPDVRECADSAAYLAQALANLTKAPGMITDLYRAAGEVAKNNPGQSALAHFVDLRDAEHAAEAARRLQRVQARAHKEEADKALAAVHRVMAGESAAHDLRVAAAGWRESADQGDASAQLLIGALYGRGGGGVKKNLPLGKRYLELSAAAGSEAARQPRVWIKVRLIKENR